VHAKKEPGTNLPAKCASSQKLVQTTNIARNHSSWPSLSMPRTYAKHSRKQRRCTPWRTGSASLHQRSTLPKTHKRQVLLMSAPGSASQQQPNQQTLHSTAGLPEKLIWGALKTCSCRRTTPCRYPPMHAVCRPARSTEAPRATLAGICRYWVGSGPKRGGWQTTANMHVPGRAGQGTTPRSTIATSCMRASGKDPSTGAAADGYAVAVSEARAPKKKHDTQGRKTTSAPRLRAPGHLSRPRHCEQAPYTLPSCTWAPIASSSNAWNTGGV
jgi:hypothetical protein